MYAILIVDAIGNVRTWEMGTYDYCVRMSGYLPENGWSLYEIVSLD